LAEIKADILALEESSLELEKTVLEDKVSYIHSLKEESIDVEPQECFTQDNVRVEVDGVIYLKVTEPYKASNGITNYKQAAIQLAQTTTRSVIGTIDLDKTFEERDLINSKVLTTLSEVQEDWGKQQLPAMK